MQRRSVAGLSESESINSDLKSLDEQWGSENDRVEGDNCSKKGEWEERWIWRACLAARLVNAMLVQTYFNADEHWQVLEVAHRVVFGYGHLTWEWQQGLRSYVHPLIFAVLYKLLAMLRLDTPWFMKKAPRLLQAFFAATGDVYLFKLAKRIFGERVAQWTLFCQMSNWFTFFCIVRTFSNCLETIFTTMALYYWWPSPSVELHSASITSRQLALLLAGLACVIRPTSAIVWLYVGTAHLCETRGKLKFLLGEVLPIGGICLGVMTLMDHWMYGKFTPVILNFFSFNFLSSGGDRYGTHPWHWYFSQGLPAMAFTFLPVAVAGIWWSKQWGLMGLIGWVLGLYSNLGHKEFRFILPVLPLVMMFAGYGLARLEQRLTSTSYLSARSLQNHRERTSSFASDTDAVSTKVAPVNVTNQWSPKLWGIIIALLLTNIPVALYTSVLHQRGGEAVMEHLAREVRLGHVKRVMFLMPCHATPFYSSLHSDVPMRFLDCSPSEEVGYVDEADRFMANPVSFLFAMFKDVKEPDMPSHIVLFDSFEPQVHMFLETHHYSLDQKFFYAHFPVDRELQGYVLLFTKLP